MISPLLTPFQCCFSLGRHAHLGTGIWVYARSIAEAFLISEIPESIHLTVLTSGPEEFYSTLNESFKNSANERVSLLHHPSFSLSRRLGYLTDAFLSTSKYSLYHGAANTLPFFCKARSVVTVHDLLQPFPPVEPESIYLRARTLYYRLYYRWLLHKADMIVTGHDQTKKLIQEHYTSNTKVKVLFPPLLSPYLQSPLSFPDTGDEQPKHLLAFASTDPRKNISCLLKSCSQTALPFHLTLVSNNHTTTRQFKREVHALGLNEQVTLLTDISTKELINLYQSCHAVIFPSLAEGFGYPAYEAISQGRAVLCSEGILVEDLRHLVGTAAIECNPWSSESITEGIEKVLQLPLDSERMSSAAHEVRTLLDPRRYAQKLLELYQEVIT
ncbi:MAG: glycosyltransferase [Bdellovibrionales bacterium]|nr:glycosyltransferase [Bdellovibrionales bacterium]